MLEEKIKAISDSAIGDSMNGRYSNSLLLNGFILQKPKFSYNKGNTCCSFIIYQIGKTYNGQYTYKTFNVLAYQPELVEKLKEEISVCCFISCNCSLQWQPKMRTYFALLHQFEISCHLEDLELEEEYQRK